MQPKKHTLRYLGVITFAKDGSRALIEYTGRDQIARKWLRKSRRWATGTVDTLGDHLSDVAPAWPHDLARFGFTLPDGHVLV